MCITVNTAELSNTKIYVGETIKNGTYVHVIAYQNAAESNGPNAMILPFPTKTEMGPENAIDTRDFKNFLDDICDATKIRTLSSSRGLKLDRCEAAAAQIFDVGSYTVILANHVSQIPQKLKEVPENKRPTISSRFLLQYGGLYPNKPVAVCCWNGKIKPEPLLWWYEPQDKDVFFVPTMDAHDGNPPDINAKVQTDHIISIGSSITELGSDVHYTQHIPYEIKNLLPNRVRGYRTEGLIKNGDMFIDVADLKKEYAVIKRGLSSTNYFYFKSMNGWTND